MIITFKLNYFTQWGQTLYLSGSAAQLGSNEPSKALSMQYTDNGNWEATIELDEKNEQVSYKYLIRHESQAPDFWEWGSPRTIDVAGLKTRSIIVEDSWRTPTDLENPMFSQAFVGNLFKRSESQDVKVLKNANCRLQLLAPRIDQHQSFCVVGSCKSLGNWEPKQALVMNDANYPVWQIDLKLGKNEASFEYKYAIYDHKEKKLKAWESGQNRHFQLATSHSNSIQIKTDQKFRYPFGMWRGAGVAIPVFSIRTNNSWGVGEFLDIKLLIDWAKKVQMKLVQILPINDTIARHTWTDSYPYAAISVFALHPIYLNLPAMGTLKDPSLMKEFEQQGAKLNALDKIDFEAVMKVKSAYFKKLYDQEKDIFLSDPGFKSYYEDNKDWLVPYAAFCRIRDQYQTPNFNEWGDYAVYDHDKITALINPAHDDYDDYAVHFFIQYHLHLQLHEAAGYARQQGVVLKGDLPIGIYRDSVDAWVEPQLYHMDKQAGAPPDDYAISGQNWGFPTYNWDQMAKDGYAWWRKRLTKMAEYFDAYRIDHILGFFRIWEIPWHSLEGLMGRFNPAIPMFKYELEGNGLHFDYDRLCKPYIREYMLHELFGEYVEEVKHTYLNKGVDDFYYMKDDFDTQRKVEEYIESKISETGDKERWLKIKYGLFTLIGNVLFHEDPESNGLGFHPKIALHFTYSFKELDESAKAAIDRVYIHYYYHRQESFWRDKAMVKLPAIINATNMLVCGEDLGMVPKCVPGVMEELGILNLEIQRMPKGGDEEFSHPADNKYLGVVSPSCHDMSTIRGWWEEDHERTQRFYNQLLGHFGAAPQFCEPWVSREMIVQHLHTSSMWAIFPIQDLVAINADLRFEKPQDERINDPSNPNHYWRFRFHLSVEELLEATDFNHELSRLVTMSGRDGKP
jgi:4-alpha-glucanotransferase